MRKSGSIYLVEGEDEKKLVRTLITDMQLIRPGKVLVFNAVQQNLNSRRIVTFGEYVTVVLVFDTDCGNIDILSSNIRLLQKQSNVHEVLCVPQVTNLEDELLRACKIKSIRELTSSSSDAKYKRDLIRATNLDRLLEKAGFQMNLFWAKEPCGIFSSIHNDSGRIRR